MKWFFGIPIHGFKGGDLVRYQGRLYSIKLACKDMVELTTQNCAAIRELKDVRAQAAGMQKALEWYSVSEETVTPHGWPEKGPGPWQMSHWDDGEMARQALSLEAGREMLREVEQLRELNSHNQGIIQERDEIRAECVLLKTKISHMIGNQTHEELKRRLALAEKVVEAARDLGFKPPYSLSRLADTVKAFEAAKEGKV